MTAEELWKKSGLTGSYESWAFDDAPDKLAALVKSGVKTATCSSYDLYQTDGEPLPKEGDYSVILDSSGEAVCIVKTVKVYIAEFHLVSSEHAYKEGEGDRTLEYWRKVHTDFLIRELSKLHLTFSENTKVVCEEFELVYA
ncbi:MAG: ASCH domain-containing protein [Clostridia bacterium]|nr:ASCH domain-containing protein [Clostridia bacterium]